MRTVIIYIIGVLLAVAAYTADATAYGGLALVVLAEVLRIWQHCLEELQRDNLHFDITRSVSKWRLVLYFVDTTHSNVLYHLKVLQILLTEGHPETGALYCGVIYHERLYLLVVQEVAVARTDVRIVKILVNLQRFCLHPFAVFPVESLLGYLADVYLGIEVRGERLVVVAGIAIYYVKVLYLLEVVLRGVGGKDACHPGVEAAAKNGSETGFLETLAVCPLPRILKMCLVLGLVVSSVKVVAAAGKTRIHNGQVLIGQRKVYHQLGLEGTEELLQLLHVVGIYLRGLNVHIVTRLMNVGNYLVALLLTAARYHKLSKDVWVLRNLKGCYGGNTTGANH